MKNGLESKLSNYVQKAKSLAKSIANKALITSAALAPFVAPFASDVHAQSVETNRQPVVFWGDVRNSNGAMNRYINTTPATQAVYDFPVFVNPGTNKVGRISFEVHFPTNKLITIGLSFPFNSQGYIGNGSGIYTTNDLFYPAQINERVSGNPVIRSVVSGTSPETLINQNGTMAPAAYFTFKSQTNQHCLAPIVINNTHAYDLNNIEIPSMGTQTSVLLEDGNFFINITTNAVKIIDLNKDPQGRTVPIISIHSSVPYIRAPYTLTRSFDGKCWSRVKTANDIKFPGFYEGFTFIDWEASTDSSNMALYNVVR